MWKQGFSALTQPIFTQRFHAPLQRVSSAMPDALTQGSGLLRARRILTMVPGLEGECLWWEQGRIRGVGSAADMERAAPPGIPRLELPRALITPGLVDGHTHLALWALNRRRVELSGS